ncbi:unnamed protein product [[Candida] boidinii]|nr:unnamed protein product [[Candida] boidinii]
MSITISALPLIDLISKSLKLKGIDTDELNFELEKLHKWFEELLKIFKKVNLKKTDVVKTTEISSNIGKANGNGSGSSSNGTSDEKLINKQLRLINENIKNIFEIGFKEDEDKIEDFYNEDSDYKINDKIFCFCRQVESG